MRRGTWFFPGDADNGEAALICVPVYAIPFFRLFFAEMQAPTNWKDRESWWRGYQLAAELEEQLMSGCVNDLKESIDRIYRLLDTSLNGTEYEAVEDPEDAELTIITPAIGEIPNYDSFASPGLRARFERLVALQENFVSGRTYAAGNLYNPLDPGLSDELGMRETLRAIQGIINAGWFGIGGRPAQIVDIIEALRIGNQAGIGDVLSAISAILSAGGSVAAIYSALDAFLNTTVGNAAEGGLIGALIVSQIASAQIAAAGSGSGFTEAERSRLLLLQERISYSLNGIEPPAGLDGNPATFGRLEALLVTLTPTDGSNRLSEMIASGQLITNTRLTEIRDLLQTPAASDQLTDIITALTAIQTTVQASNGIIAGWELVVPEIAASLVLIKDALTDNNPNDLAAIADLLREISEKLD